MKWIMSPSILLLFVTPTGAQLISSHAPTAAQVAQLAPSSVVPAKVGDTPVVRVNGVALTDRDLVREEYAIFPYARQHGGLPKSMEPQIRRGALDMIVFEELVYQEALRRKMTIPAERMRRAESDFQAQFPSGEDFESYLKNECRGSRQVLREKIRRSLLIEKFMKLEVADKSGISEAEARDYFVKHPQQFRIAESFAIQTISILPPRNATPAQLAEAKNRAQQAYQQAKATKSYEQFGLLAEKISEDDWRVNMGDRKSVPPDRLPPEVLKAAAGLQPGQISDLLELGTAFTIVRLNAHTRSGSVNFGDVKARLMSGLRMDKYNRLRAELGKRLRNSAKVEIL